MGHVYLVNCRTLSYNTEGQYGTAFILKFHKSTFPPALFLSSPDLLRVKRQRVNIEQTESHIRT